MRIELCQELRGVARLSAALGARQIVQGEPPREIRGISTDSREVCPGDLFVALPGAYSHGECYLQQALDRGATALLHTVPQNGLRGSFYFFYVPDVVKALLAAAAYRRLLQDGEVIAVTGSAGKTTVKEAIGAVLGDVPQSKGNFNSEIGMPLSVLSLPRAPYWVLELGISHVGEMERMAAALRPTLGVLTNVGSAHIGELGSFDTIFCEKAELARQLAPGGRFLAPAHFAKTRFALPSDRVFSVGVGKNADLRLEGIRIDADGSSCDLRGLGRVISGLSWPVPGDTGLSVIGLSAGVGVLCGREEKEIREGLLRAAKKAPRMKRLEVCGRVLLDDSYNASPEATVAALEVLRHLAQGRATLAVLGDILELGKYSEVLHRAVGRAVMENGICRLITYGECARLIAAEALALGMPQAAVKSYAVGEEQDLINEICRQKENWSAVLFKASHKMAMWHIAREVGERLCKESI